MIMYFLCIVWNMVGYTFFPEHHVITYFYSIEAVSVQNPMETEITTYHTACIMLFKQKRFRLSFKAGQSIADCFSFILAVQ